MTQRMARKRIKAVVPAPDPVDLEWLQSYRISVARACYKKWFAQDTEVQANIRKEIRQYMKDHQQAILDDLESSSPEGHKLDFEQLPLCAPSLADTVLDPSGYVHGHTYFIRQVFYAYGVYIQSIYDVKKPEVYLEAVDPQSTMADWSYYLYGWRTDRRPPS